MPDLWPAIGHLPRERRPRSNAWVQNSNTRRAEQVLRSHGAAIISVWHSRGVTVISTLDMAKAPDGSGDVIPQWHISVTRRGRRPRADDVTRALLAFGMTGAEEDNHHPGQARNWFLPVDPSRRVDCECKETEVVVVEDDGYTWTTDPSDCRGCEHERMFGTPPCRFHSASGKVASR